MEEPHTTAMHDDSSSRSSSLDWIEWFHSLPGHEIFVGVDLDFIEDRFNLTGLNLQVPMFPYAYRLILDRLNEDLDERTEGLVDRAAKNLYGLIHARYILTSAGLAKMADLYSKREFGICPRALCSNQAVLPIGITDTVGERSVKQYCPKCQDVYSPQSRRYESIDGAFFTTSFPHMFFQAYPQLLPVVQLNAVENPDIHNHSYALLQRERYIPRIFGFKVHESANEIAYQEYLKKEQYKRLIQQQQLQQANEASRQ